MPSLIHKKTDHVLAKSVTKASHLLEKIRGLIGKDNLSEQEAFWIPSCPSIHTFFMKFPIDVIFVDKNMKVTSCFKGVKPYRIVMGSWKSNSVFEMQAGKLNQLEIKKGDELYVGN